MADQKKIVVVAALDGTFQRKPFGSVLDLIPLSDEVTKLNAVCMMCYQDAPFSRRIGSEMAVEVIGGADKVRRKKKTERKNQNFHMTDNSLFVHRHHSTLPVVVLVSQRISKVPNHLPNRHSYHLANR
jgi:hypothetical protein